MTYPYDPQEADAALRAQLSAQADQLAAPPAPAPDLSAAQPAAVDAASLLARIQELEANQQAAAAAAPVPDEPDNSLHVDASAPGYLHALVAQIEARLSALEGNA